MGQIELFKHYSIRLCGKKDPKKRYTEKLNMNIQFPNLSAKITQDEMPHR